MSRDRHYPTLAEVERQKDNEAQIHDWYHWLPSPGHNAMNQPMPIFEQKLKEEKVILDRIVELFRAQGRPKVRRSKKC
jgi:hypothetical protein